MRRRQLNQLRQSEAAQAKAREDFKSALETRYFEAPKKAAPDSDVAKRISGKARLKKELWE